MRQAMGEIAKLNQLHSEAILEACFKAFRERERVLIELWADELEFSARTMQALCRGRQVS